MKRVSVAEAKNRLPALIHEAEEAPIEITRRGEVVAALVSRKEYERLPKQDWYAAIMEWREKYKDVLLGDEEEWIEPRDKDPGGGRDFSWE